jgi:hypothetical protein
LLVNGIPENSVTLLDVNCDCGINVKYCTAGIRRVEAVFEVVGATLKRLTRSVYNAGLNRLAGHYMLNICQPIA